MTDTSKATARPMAEKPWAWRKCYEMGNGSRHWALVSIPQRDAGVGDGLHRVLGLILFDSWSKTPDPLMVEVLDAVNNYDRLKRVERLAAELVDCVLRNAELRFTVARELQAAIGEK